MIEEHFKISDQNSGEKAALPNKLFGMSVMLFTRFIAFGKLIEFQFFVSIKQLFGMRITLFTRFIWSLLSF